MSMLVHGSPRKRHRTATIGVSSSNLTTSLAQDPLTSPSLGQREEILSDKLSCTSNDIFKDSPQPTELRCDPTRRLEPIRVGNGCDMLCRTLAQLGGWRRVSMQDEHVTSIVWVMQETAENRAAVDSARVASVLDGIGVVLSWKSNLALVQREVQHRSPTSPTALTTYILEGVADLERWCRGQFVSTSLSKDRLWMLKDALSNSGSSVWVLSECNWRSCVEQRRQEGDLNVEYVAQEYVAQPELWQDRFKFHFRVYACVTGDLAVMLYAHAFAHVANKAYDLQYDPNGEGYSNEIHISNVAANVSNLTEFKGYPCVNMPQDRPHVWNQIVESMTALVEAASPFLLHQRGHRHFAHIGADYIVDTGGRAHLLEMNIPPCMGSQSSDDGADTVVASLMIPQLTQLLHIMTAHPHSACVQPQPDSGWVLVKTGRRSFVASTPTELGLNGKAWEHFQRDAMINMRNEWSTQRNKEDDNTHAPTLISTSQVQWNRKIAFA